MKRFFVCFLAAFLLFQQTALAMETETFAYYEALYPHPAVYEITDSKTGAVSYRTSLTEFAPWQSQFMPYYWETRLPYRIFEKRFSHLPDIGWVEQEENPAFGVSYEDVYRVSGDYEPVQKHYRLFGFGNFRIVGENRVAPAQMVYHTYPGGYRAIDWSQFSPEVLSQKDNWGNYLVSDEAITKQIPLYDSAYLTGRNYAKGGTMTIDVAKEVIDGADPNLFDPSILQPSQREHTVSWQLCSEPTEPYRQYEVLRLDGILLVGRVENGVQLPHIYRYTGEFGKVEPVEQVYDSAQIYVFTYHWISEDPQNWGDYTITQEEFRKDIRYLYENGFYFATPGELYRLKGKYPAEKIALVTFDDGYAACYTEALPVLEQYGAKATMFLVGSYLNTPDYLTEEQLRSMAESPLIELGNHSYKLHDLSKMEVSKLYQKDIDHALSDYYQNEELVFSLTGKTMTTLSYPYGEYTKKLDHYLKDHGYEVTFSTRADSNHSPDLKSPLNRLNRSLYTTAEELISLYGN